MEQTRGLLFTGYFTEEPNYKFSAECPCLGRSEMSIILIHVDDLVFTGDSKYASVSKIERMGDEFNFLRRKYKLEVDGVWIQPGSYIQQMVKPTKSRLGLSNLNNYQPTTCLFRSVVGSGIYLCQERYDVAFTVKETASRM